MRFPANSSHMYCVELSLKGVTSAVKGLSYTGNFPVHRHDGYAILMSPNKGETAIHGCHCPCDVAVRMREVLARPWVGVCMPLALSWSLRTRQHAMAAQNEGVTKAIAIFY